MKPYLSVVIPAYNEVKDIENGVLTEVADYLRLQKYAWEVIIVNDSSTDNTLELIKKFVSKQPGFRVMDEPHRGKAGTVIAGMLSAQGEIVLFTDMDQATPLKEVEKFLPEFKEGYDGVIGKRTGRKGAPLARKVMAYGFMVLRYLILRLPYKDTQCGFKAFKNEAAKKVFGKMKVFGENTSFTGPSVNAAFDLELLYISRKLGLRVIDVPVAWDYRETKRVSPIKDSVEAIFDMLRVRRNALMGKYR